MKDALGSELAVGDAVHVKIGAEWVMANILKIQNGGIAVTGVPRDKNSPVGVTPDLLVLQVGIGFQQAPGTPQAMVMKLAAPNRIDLVESALKM